VLSQGEPRDAAVNFDTFEFYKGIVRFLCHSTAFLYRLTSATVRMLKLHTVRWCDAKSRR